MRKKLVGLSLIVVLLAVTAFAVIGIIDNLRAASGDRVSYSNEAGADVFRVESDGSIYTAGHITTDFNYTTVAAATDALVVDDCGFVEVRYATCTITLPTAVGNAGLWYSIKHTTTTTGVVSLTPLVAGQTIDGTAGANTSMDTQYDTLGVFSNGANWLIWTRYIQ